MNRCPSILTILAIAALTACGQTSSPTSKPAADVGKAVDALVRAAVAKDPAAKSQAIDDLLAAGRDPFFIVEEILRRADAAGADRSTIQSTASQFVERLGLRPRHRRLGDYVAARAALDPESVAAEREIGRLLEVARSANDRRDLKTALETRTPAAAARAAKAPGTVLGAALLHEWALAADRSGLVDLALECERAVAAVAREWRWFERYENALLCIDDIACRRRRFAEAEAAADLALVAAREIADKNAEAFALQRRASARRSAWRGKEAVADFEGAVRLFEEAQSPLRAADARRALGVTLAYQGEIARGLEELDKARLVVERLGDEFDRGLVLGSIANVDRKLGRIDRALEGLRQKAALDEKRGNIQGLALDLTSIGECEWRLGKTKEAEATFLRLLAIGEREHDVTAIENAAMNLGMIAAEQRDFERSLEWFARVQAARGAETTVSRNTQLLGNIAVTEFKLGRFADAEKRYREIIAVAQTIGDRALEAQTERNLALLLHRTERFAEALLATRRSVEATSRVAPMLGEDALHILEDIGECGTPAYLAWAGISAQDPESAKRHLADLFRVVEGSHGQVLLGGVKNRDALLGAGVPAEVRAGFDAARRRASAAQARLIELAARSDVEATLVQEAKTDLEIASKELDDALVRLRSSARDVTTYAFPVVEELAQVQAAWAADAAYIQIHISDYGNFAFVATRETAACVKLGGKSDVPERAAALVDLLSTEGSDEADAAAEMYDDLIRPLEPYIRSKRRLVVAADEHLSFIPFEALLREDNAGDRRLVESHEISYAPSASFYLAIRAHARARPRGRGFLGFGDPIYPSEAEDSAALARSADLAEALGRLDRLPESGVEVRNVGAFFPADARRVFVRGDATAERVLSELKNTKEPLAAVHFGCHALIDARRPQLTGLVLGGGATLNLAAIHDLRLPADLVCLSACATARGRVRLGEGVIGLTRGFFFAGATRCVVSNWRVADKATAVFMTDFYGAMVRDGDECATALAKAKRAMLWGDRSRRHPYYWAPFVLWGIGER